MLTLILFTISLFGFVIMTTVYVMRQTRPAYTKAMKWVLAVGIAITFICGGVAIYTERTNPMPVSPQYELHYSDVK